MISVDILFQCIPNSFAQYFYLEETNFENNINLMNTGRLNKNKFNPNILNKTRIPPATANNNSEIIETTQDIKFWY